MVKIFLADFSETMQRLKSLISYVTSIGVYNTFNYIFQRYIQQKHVISVKVKGIKNSISLRRNSTDLNVFQQLFVKKDLAFLQGRDLQVIIDVGANIGLATVYLKKLFPKAQIFCIEPEKSNFKLLQMNTKRYNGITLIKKALSEDNKGLILLDTGKGNDAFQTIKQSDLSHINWVESISINDIMKEYNLSKLDLVKIDIEGAEQYCINDKAMSWINVTQILAVEIHEHIIPGSEIQIKQLLKDCVYHQQGEYSVFEN